MKYLFNTMKITAMVGIMFFGLAVFSKADEPKKVSLQDSVTNASEFVKSAPGKVKTWFENEKAETIEFQKESWASAKEQNARNIAKIKEFFGFN